MTIQTHAPGPPETLLEKEEAHATMALIGGGGDDSEGGEEEDMREGGGAMYTPPCHQRSRRLAPTTTSPEKGACDLLDYMPKSGSKHRSHVRSARKRRTWLINTKPCSQDLHSTSEGQKHGRERNNDHLTSKEVKELVDGISAYGARQWANLKNERFPISVRTAKRLMGNMKRRVSPRLDKDCVEKIQRLVADYPRK
ncbi:hypothetical protein VPH35_140298 [Triticum aestivum]